MGDLVPAAGVAIFSADGELLLARHAHDEAWALVGGRVEAGESPAAAAAREAREEVGLAVADLVEVGAFWDSPIYTVQYPDWGPTSYHVTVFATVLDEVRTPVPDGVEIVEAAWFTPAQIDRLALATDMAEIVPAALAWWRDRRTRLS